jgi:hypothetical protein
MQQQKGFTMTKKLPRLQKNGGAGAKSWACSVAHTPLKEDAPLHFGEKPVASFFQSKGIK